MRLEWVTNSSTQMSAAGGLWKISMHIAGDRCEYKLYRSGAMQGRIECRNGVVDRTDALAELKRYAETVSSVLDDADEGDEE